MFQRWLVFSAWLKLRCCLIPPVQCPLLVAGWCPPLNWQQLIYPHEAAEMTSGSEYRRTFLWVMFFVLCGRCGVSLMTTYITLLINMWQVNKLVEWLLFETWRWIAVQVFSWCEHLFVCNMLHCWSCLCVSSRMEDSLGRNVLTVSHMNAGITL